MGNARNGTGALVLVLVTMFGLMTASAQASEKSWLVEGKDITSNQAVEVSPHTELNLMVEKESKLEILCAKVEAKDFLLLSGTTTATGEILYTTCKTWQAGALKSNCKPTEPIAMGGKALLILHNTKTYVLLEPAIVGEKFGVIKFNVPCALPETNNIKGSLVVECLKTSNLEAVDCKQEEESHLWRPNESLFPEDNLIYGTKAIKLNLWAWIIKLVSHRTWCGHV